MYCVGIGVAPTPNRSQTSASKGLHHRGWRCCQAWTSLPAKCSPDAVWPVLRLFMIQLETRKVTLAGITRRPMEEGLIKVARNLTDAEAEPIWDSAYRLHDRDTKFCNRFPSILREVGVEPLRLPRRSPN
jgi:hypothetical protein